MVVTGFSLAPGAWRLELRFGWPKGTGADCCCLLSLGDFGTMPGGLVERQCTSLRKGLAGEGARFNLFFSNWWFCGLVSLPEPSALSIIHRHRRQEGGEGNDQPTAPRKTSDTRHQKDGRVALPCSRPGMRILRCAGRVHSISYSFTRLPLCVLPLPSFHEAPRSPVEEKPQQKNGITGNRKEGRAGCFCKTRLKLKRRRRKKEPF